jgi:A/G-specific adenine glycosylase
MLRKRAKLDNKTHNAKTHNTPRAGSTRRAGKAAKPRRRANLAQDLLAWYDANRREFPWRAKAGERPDPYRVWLSEIMLQQTTVVTVAPYYQRFLARWPDVHALARSNLDDVLGAWQGLGYYARARNLHACAKTVSREWGGVFPDSEAALRTLPGIGAYTAGAIAAIAFDKPASAVDGNVERVVARMFAVKTPLPTAKPQLQALAAKLVPEKRAGDFAQSLMDIGATLCTPRHPDCGHCPWNSACAARKLGIAEQLPQRTKKRPRPERFAVAYFIARKDGAIWLRRRDEKGLLGGMMEVPSTAWRNTPWQDQEARTAAPVETTWRRLPGDVEHGFTHFRLNVRVMAAEIEAKKLKAKKLKGGRWVRPDDLGEAALPTVMKKIIAFALGMTRSKGEHDRKPGQKPGQKPGTKKPAYTGGAAGLIRQEPSVRGGMNEVMTKQSAD